MGETETVHAEIELEADVEVDSGLSLISHAGFIPRLVAYLLDLALLSIPAIGYARATTGLERLVALALPLAFDDLSAWILWAVFAGAALVYFSVLEAYAGRTVGKRFAGIKVTDLQGDPPDPTASLTRNLYRALHHLPVAGQVLLAVDGYLVLVHGQRLGDLAADTLVVKEPGEWTG